MPRRFSLCNITANSPDLVSLLREEIIFKRYVVEVLPQGEGRCFSCKHPHARRMPAVIFGRKRRRGWREVHCVCPTIDQ